jgi:excisionase family DNA binding protein
MARRRRPAFDIPENERLLSPAEVAALFKVSSVSVTRWARAGKLPFIWTPGGSRRYREAEVRALLNGTREGGHA